MMFDSSRIKPSQSSPRFLAEAVFTRGPCDRSQKVLEKEAKDTTERILEELQPFYAKLNK